MTVGELIKDLKDIDPTTLIVQSTDAEGNSIRNTDDISAGWFTQGPGEWEGEYDEDKDEDSESPGRVSCICFWPVN